jgi:DNA-binding response OmpR family regulator
MTAPIIVLVDDDPAMLESLSAVLGKDYRVEQFQSGKEALDASSRWEPDVIISDIVMPDMGGFEFRRAYALRYGRRATPFLFLSSIGDPETMVAGLEAGADDFLVKPIVPELLRARVKAVLRRRAVPRESSFRGDLSHIPFASLLQFCETKRFTGELAIEVAGESLVLSITAGELDASANVDSIDTLWDLTEGRFVLRSTTTDFAGLPRGFEQEAPPSERPGRLSSVVVRGRRLQIETEVVDGDELMLVTLVLAGQDPVAKTKQRVARDTDLATLRGLVDAQHEAAEAATHDRVAALRHRIQHGPAPQSGLESTGAKASEMAPRAEAAPRSLSSTSPSSRVTGNLEAETPTLVAALFEEGYEHSREGNWQGALQCWERALVAEPSNRTLALNVEVARKKLRSQQGLT